MDTQRVIITHGVGFYNPEESIKREKECKRRKKEYKVQKKI